MTHKLDQLSDYPFPRLAALLEGIQPGGPGTPINLSLGEPKHPFPEFVVDILNQQRAGYGKYPPMNGTDDFRAAVCEWLTGRYQLDGPMLDPARHVLPVNGTREGLFNIALAAVPAEKAGKQPAVLMPNPFYQCYAGAAVTAGAEPIYVPALRENNFMPDYAALPQDLLARTALVYLCSPANPQGTVADMSDLKALVELAREHNFTLVMDECYSEIYDNTPPPGGLQAAAELAAENPNAPSNPFANVVVFHSLSKRSNLPGLRSGFCAGDPDLIARFRHLRNYGGAASPLPVYAAAAAAWRDEDHVLENRTRYREKFDLAERILQNSFGFYRPAGSFYLWLHVDDGEAAAKRLWQYAGLKVLPGRYLAQDIETTDGITNPGAAYIRLALVEDAEVIGEALERLGSTLGQ